MMMTIMITMTIKSQRSRLKRHPCIMQTLLETEEPQQLVLPHCDEVDDDDSEQDDDGRSTTTTIQMLT